jgi:hypothetical protein
MSSERFQRRVASVEELTELLGAPSTLAVKKQRLELDKHMQAFIDESPFLLLGTVGRQGACDVSPRGDAPGFVRILDSRTLIIPERRGNRRVDSLRNIVETSRVGLLFLIPGLGETLRINGSACVIRDEEILAPLAVQGQTPLVGVAVSVEECFLQCAKAVLRSKLWEGLANRPQRTRPSFGEILLDQTQIAGETAESLDQLICDSYTNHLY